MIIDATNLILGRLASFTAKNLLKGDKVIIINAEKAVISGQKKMVFGEFKYMVDIGDVFKGPFIQKTPDGIVRRVIRGMVPRKKAKGREALKRLRVYIGKPKELKGDIKTLKEFDKSNLQNPKYITINELSSYFSKGV